MSPILLRFPLGTALIFGCIANNVAAFTEGLMIDCRVTVSTSLLPPAAEAAGTVDFFVGLCGGDDMA